jgi:HAMP domain-containing protein
MTNTAVSPQKNKSLSLKWLLIIPFVLQIVAAVGLVGYLSYQSGQKAVDNLAKSLITEVSERINQNMISYFRKITEVTINNADALRLGIIPWQNLDSNLGTIEQYLYQQAKAFSIGSYIADEQKNVVTAGSNGIRVSNKSTNYNLDYYLTDKQGKRIKLIGSLKNYNPHNDPPNNPTYKMVKKENRSMWRLTVSQVSVKGKIQRSLIAANSMPFYNRNNTFQGVVASAVMLSRTGDFLKNLKIGQTGQAFIIDRDGLVIATSTGEVPFSQALLIPKADTTFKEEKLDPAQFRLNIINSSNLITQKTSAYLKNYFTGFHNINKAEQLHIEIDRKYYFVRIAPFQSEKDLDWLTIVVVPESDFMQEIQANTRMTFILCFLTLLIASILSIITASLITKPIRRLSLASKAIAEGQLNQTVEISGTAELKILAGSFNQMAHQLKESFETLEHRVEERTAELVIAKEKAEVLLLPI